MTDAKPSRPAVFIEKIFPVTLLNQQVYYEHGGNPFKGLHRWYSRKPLSFSRASVLGSLLPDTVTPEEFEYLLGLQRRLGGQPDTTTKLYKTPPSPERIKQVHDLCEQTWGTRTPTVLDAFAGGGSIPFEAVRYGLNVLASDLNPVAVVTMKAAMEYPLKFGPDLQHEIDKWVKWVGDEAEKRLAEFFPSQEGETVQNYLWAHTVVCPSCESVVPLSPNWWLYKRPEKQNLHKWCAVKPIPNPAEKRVDFELVKGRKGKGSSIQTSRGDFNPDAHNTISRGVGRCLNCENIIQDEVIKSYAQSSGLGHQMYAVSFKRGKGSLEFRLPNPEDLEAVRLSQHTLEQKREHFEALNLIPLQEIPSNTHRGPDMYLYGIHFWNMVFSSRQLLTLATYVELIKELKSKIRSEEGEEKEKALSVYLTLALDRCIDKNSRLSHWQSGRVGPKRATTQHTLSLFWCYPETNGAQELWKACAEKLSDEYLDLCELMEIDSESQIPDLIKNAGKSINVLNLSADNLSSVPDKALGFVITDPPYYDSIQYGEISDFFYVWQRLVLSDVFPDSTSSEYSPIKIAKLSPTQVPLSQHGRAA
jgi:putative DNA methylase